MSDDYVLEMVDIVKEFSGVRVLHGVNIKVRRGEIHALCGENGAGKSTLMKILSGAHPQGSYHGEILIDGMRQDFRNTRESAAAGVEIIYQELEVATEMTVAENIFLGRELLKNGVLDYSTMNELATGILGRLGMEIDPHERMANLGVGMRQMTVIAKALLKNPKVLIMDEPSAALTEREVGRMLSLVGQLAAEGVAVIYISHRLDEVMQIADTITVLRDGHTIATLPRSEVKIDNLIKHMVGRELNEQYVRPKAHRLGDVMLRVEGLSAVDTRTGRPIIEGVSFDVRAGEIVGIAGLMGAGRTETVLAIMGSLDSAVVSGAVSLEGEALHVRKPRDAIRHGIYLVVEDRKEKGLVLCLNVEDNMTLSSLKQLSKRIVIDQYESLKLTQSYVKSLNVRVLNPALEVGRLSGGNQQKVVLSKALMTKPKVLILDEPTRGIDVGAKHEIYQIISDLCAQGIAIVMISSELPEILSLSDRVLVMNHGKLVADLPNDASMSQELIMTYAALKE